MVIGLSEVHSGSNWANDLKLQALLLLNCTTRSPITIFLCQEQNARNSGIKDLI